MPTINTERSQALVKRLVELHLSPAAPARVSAEAARALNLASILSMGGQDEAALALLETACGRLGMSDLDLFMRRHTKAGRVSRSRRARKA